MEIDYGCDLMLFHLSPRTKNSKIGNVHVSTSDKATCPDSCPLKGNGCYASSGPMAIHWNKVSKGERGDSWEDFLLKVSALPKGDKFRHNQAGDLPGENEEIDSIKLDQLSDVIAKRELQAYTYTHKPLTDSNIFSIRKAIAKGLSVNISADNLHEADEARDKGLPTVAVLPLNASLTSYTPKGRKVIVCPAQREGSAIKCDSCMLCAKANRTVVIGFLAHGTAKYKISKRLTNEESVLGK